MLIGNYAVTDDFSISFDFTGDYNFDKQRGAIFWSFGGTMELSLSFPDMVWARNNNNIQWRTTLEGVGVEGYYYYKNNTSPIHITAVYDRTNSEQRIYVDGYLLNSQSITLPPINATLDLRILEGASYDLFTGTISNVTFYNTALTLPTLPKPTPQFRVTDYPLNYVPGSQDYSTVNSPVTQLTNYQDPLFVGTTDWTGSAINLRYLAGYDGDSASMTTPVINNAVAIQTLLSDKFRFVHNVANLQEYYTENRPGLMAYDAAMISLAQANPGWTHQVTSALEHMFDISPYTLIDPSTVTVTTPITAFNDTREIYEILANYLATNAPGVTISRHLENDECLNRNNGAASRTVISQNFADRWTRMLEDLRTVFTGVDSSTYDNCDTSFFVTSGSTPIGIQADPCYEANDFFRGTVSHYTERPVYWRTYQGGNIRGLGFFNRVKYYDIQDGYELCTPYVSAGWNIQEESNVRPGQWLGILKMLKLAGAQYFNAGYFTTGTTGVQNPKGYVWQGAMPAYCEGLFSDPIYNNIILNGNLMPGDMYIFWQTQTQSEYNFWTGDKSVFCVIRKLGTEYLIGLTYQPLNNYIGQPDNKDGIITFDGNTFTLNARVQGSVYYWDSSLGGSPTQIDTWHESFHPERWNSIIPPPDVTAPVVTTTAGSLDVTINCNDNTALLAALALFPSATDDIDPNPTMMLISDTEINPGGCPNIRTRIWNFTDSSGNVSLNFTQTIIILPLIPTSNMNERIIISKQIEPSLTPGSVIRTDSQNVQEYVPPGNEGDVLQIVSGYPEWLDLSLAGVPVVGTPNVISKFTPVTGTGVVDSRLFDDGQNASFNAVDLTDGDVIADTLITYRNFLTATGNNKEFHYKYYNQSGNMMSYLKDNGDFFCSNGLSITDETSLTFSTSNQSLTLKGASLGTTFAINNADNTFAISIGTYGQTNQIISTNGFTNTMPNIHIGSGGGGTYLAMAITDQFTLIKPTDKRVAYGATTGWSDCVLMIEETLNVLGSIGLVSGVTHTDAATPGDQDSPKLKLKTSIYDGGVFGATTGEFYSIQHTTASNKLEITNSVGAGTVWFHSDGGITNDGTNKWIHKGVTVVAGPVTMSTTTYVTVNIGGVDYKLATIV